MDAPTPSENAFLLPGVLDLTVAAPLARDILARRGAPLEIAVQGEALPSAVSSFAFELEQVQPEKRSQLLRLPSQ